MRSGRVEVTSMEAPKEFPVWPWTLGGPHELLISAKRQAWAWAHLGRVQGQPWTLDDGFESVRSRLGTPEVERWDRLPFDDQLRLWHLLDAFREEGAIQDEYDWADLVSCVLGVLPMRPSWAKAPPGTPGSRPVKSSSRSRKR